MAMSQQKGKYKNNVKLAQKHLEEMLNNKKYSDTVFLVNGNQFYALSYLMAISSKAFDSLLNDHFENCGDKKIRINNVKFEDSFLIILKYIYGVEIDLDEIPPGVLCEVVCLAETYELTEFCSDLKVHLSGLKEFQVDAVVVLLNTASKLDVTQLYNRLTDFVFLNTEQLVKHRSFVDLQFHVLVDLIKSDLFFAPEIDILTAVLKWHFDMSKGRTKRQGTPEKEIVGKGVIEEENGDSDTQTEVSSFDNLDSADTFDSKSDGDDTNENLSKGTEDFIPEEQTEQSMKSCDDNIQGDQACSQMELISAFSENVLKELLSHIRIQRISALEYIKAMETELFKNYKDILMDDKHFTQNSEPRYQNHTPSSIESNVLTPSTRDVNPQSLTASSNDSSFQSVNRSTKSDDVYIVFTVPITPFCTSVSKEDVIFDNFKWRFESEYFKLEKVVSFHVHCTYDNEVEWECTVECQLHVISKYPDVPNKIFPGDKSYKSLQFSAKYPRRIIVGDLNIYSYLAWRNHHFGNEYKFEVHFKSIESKFARKKRDK
ncbi:uncharacterized protein LOC103515345 [Diaphorina citri]|uniref:Uncharacterized protein LOC103515345 n=1 Tax=Diaphorina citri TaxID=121845 RepID=A0A3Q0JAZ7_DIACI|nr:uncharacterized protein LOC103515345 [Diaphorina citri]